jgi:hypothetical protein
VGFLAEIMSYGHYQAKYWRSRAVDLAMEPSLPLALLCELLTALAFLPIVIAPATGSIPH